MVMAKKNTRNMKKKCPGVGMNPAASPSAAACVRSNDLAHPDTLAVMHTAPTTSVSLHGQFLDGSIGAAFTVRAALAYRRLYYSASTLGKGSPYQ